MNDLYLRALAGQETERRPLWIMRQAGRYLPEYRALREEHSFLELCESPELAAQVTLMPIERFPLDAAIVFADLMSPVGALGVDVRFDPGPVIDAPIRDAAAVQKLRVPDAEEIAPEVPATLSIVKERLDGRAALVGFAGSPFSIACYLVQGRGGKDFARLRAFLHEDPVAFGELLDLLAQTCAKYLKRQYAAGADVVQVFESWAGIHSRESYRHHVRPHVERLLQEVGTDRVPRVMFANGAPHLAEDLATLPAEALALCWRCDLPDLRRKLGPEVVLQGNLDPAALLAGPGPAKHATQALLAAMPPARHLVNLGHGIQPETPPESVQAVIDAVHAEGATR